MNYSSSSLDYVILSNTNFFVSDDNYDLNIYSANYKNKPKIQTKSQLGI